MILNFLMMKMETWKIMQYALIVGNLYRVDVSISLNTGLNAIKTLTPKVLMN
jgi:hypothetical protein